MYSIKEICEITGIKSHVLRSWELRHHMFSPKRCKANMRQYSQEDLDYLKQILKLRKAGFKISRIAKMSREEVAEVINRLDDQRTESRVIDEMIEAVMGMNECAFCLLWKEQTERNGVDSTLTNVIFPLIDRFNMLWITGSISKVQDQLFHRLLLRKAHTLLHGIDTVEPSRQERFLLYLPSLHSRELSLQLMSYSLKKNGFVVFDLGVLQNINEVKEAIEAIAPTHMYTQLPENFTPDQAQNYIDELAGSHFGKEILITSPPFLLNSSSFNARVRVFDSVKETIGYINYLG